ncbi:hypothetical protein FQN50_003203 [Emmonsiellopsis sp. PD_5]|nr:hypothetical protein FQN50_003203 [Emmonsiellopsis sp. PD_5]
MIGNSIIHSPPFTFLVGPEHTKLTIQSGLATHVSQRLDELMNNGHTRESRHRIAVLEEEDVETFVGFCEFAYTGDYNVPVPQLSPARRASQGIAGGIGSPLVSAARPPAPSPPATPQPGDGPQEKAADVGGEGGAGAGGEGKQEEEADVEANQQEESSKGKKGKKKQKKQKGGGNSKATATQALDEEGTAANMTPPRTPPPMTDEKYEEEGAPTTTAAAENTTPDDADTATQPPPHIPSSEAVSGPPDWFDFEATPQAEMPKLEPAFQGSFLSPKSRGLGLWGEFASLQYIHHQRTSAMALPSPLSRTHKQAQADEHGHGHGYGIAPSTSESIPYILFHAKLYVFSTRYLIPTLAQLTLKKLHRDLLSFPLSSTTPSHLAPASAAAIIQLLHFTFSNTKRDDPVLALTPTGEVVPTAVVGQNALRQNELRKLVTHYAACRVRELAAYQPSADGAEMGLGMGVGMGGGSVVDTTQLGFRDLLDAVGELASDLVYRMM